MRGKPISISPSVVTQLQSEWAAVVESAEAIFSVGVRPLLEDEHVWIPISNSRGTLFFIGDRSAFEKWSPGTRIGSSEYLGSRFNESFPRILRRLTAYATK
jgi:hypothetical protein